MTEKRQLFISEFEHLYKENYANMYHYAFTIVDDMELAKDIVGEVFSMIWDNYDILNKEKIKGYLIISIRNRCIDWVREQEKLRAYTTQIEKASEIDEDAANNYEENLQHIEALLVELKPQTRLILELHYYDHKTYDDIATELEISSRMVKRKVMTALAYFRDSFNKNKRI